MGEREETNTVKQDCLPEQQSQLKKRDHSGEDIVHVYLPDTRTPEEQLLMTTPPAWSPTSALCQVRFSTERGSVSEI